MDSPEDVIRLIEEAQAGSAEAAEKLYEQHEALLRRVIRRHLNQSLRRTYDSNDFLQAVWASFFRVDNGKRTFDSPKALMELLKQMARNKVVDAQRAAQSRPEGHAYEPDTPSEDLLDSVKGNEASPSQNALANEAWNRILHNQPRIYRAVLEMLRNGHTHQEIADRLGLNEKTIRRLIARLKSNGRES